MQDVTEIKHKLSGETVEYPCKAVVLDSDREAVLLYLIRHDGLIKDVDVSIAKGTLSLGHYWSDRPYNVYHWLDPSGESIGYYFNVAGDTIIRRDRVEWRDLIVDFWLGADGQTALLDVDELPLDLSAELERQIDTDKAEILRDHSCIADAVRRRSDELLARIDAG